MTEHQWRDGPTDTRQGPSGPSPLQIVDIWIVWQGPDDHGRKGMIIGIYSTEAAARIAADGKGWYGGDGATAPAKAIYAGEGSYYVIDREFPVPVKLDVNFIQERDRLKKAALAKLTAIDREVLGIKE